MIVTLHLAFFKLIKTIYEEPWVITLSKKKIVSLDKQIKSF